jgi:hypothetical protein
MFEGGSVRECKFKDHKLLKARSSKTFIRLRRPLVHASRLKEELVSRLGGQRTVVVGNLHVDAIRNEAALLLPLHVIIARVLRETPLLRLDNLLAARELVLGAAERLNSLVRVHVLGTDGQHDLTNRHPRGDTLRGTVRTTHTRLQAIRTSARKHLVDTQNVERVQAHAKVETFLTSLGHHVLVRGNTAGFHSLGADLFLFETTNRE